MPLEIERKFLLSSNMWKESIQQSTILKQGYLSKEIDKTIRIRIYGEQGKITIKSKSVHNVRAEYEYDIPLQDALELLDMFCDPKELVHKIRHIVVHDNHMWEIDEFIDHNKGLFLAEIELQHPNEEVILPSWIGQEVSDDPRYSNSYLAQHCMVDAV